jgi:hypothetical protein
VVTAIIFFIFGGPPGLWGNSGDFCMNEKWHDDIEMWKTLAKSNKIMFFRYFTLIYLT